MRNQSLDIKHIVYRFGAWSALIAALIFRRNMDAEYYLLHGFGLFGGEISSAPDSAAGWIDLMQTQPLLGLTLLNALDLINIALIGIIFISIVVVLWNERPYLMGMAALMTICAVIYFFFTNQAFAFYRLSQEIIHLDSSQQALYYDQAETLLKLHFSNHYAPGSIYPSYLLITLAGLFLGIQMLNSNTFTILCAWMGILANAIALTYWGFHFLLPEFEFIAPAISAIFLLVWYILIGLQLLKLVKSSSKVNNQA